MFGGWLCWIGFATITVTPWLDGWMVCEESGNGIGFDVGCGCLIGHEGLDVAM